MRKPPQWPNIHCGGLLYLLAAQRGSGRDDDIADRDTPSLAIGELRIMNAGIHSQKQVNMRRVCPDEQRRKTVVTTSG